MTAYGALPPIDDDVYPRRIISATDDLAGSPRASRDVARGPISSVQPVLALAIMDGREAEEAVMRGPAGPPL